MNFVLLLLLLVSVANAATIKICVKKKEEGITAALSRAAVQCWDEDSLDTDDAMTSTKLTGSNGCVTRSYTKKTSSLFKCTGWDCSTNPDIYCKVTKPGLYPLYTDTKQDWNQDTTANFATVIVYPKRTGDPGQTNGCGSVYLPSKISSLDLTGFENPCNNHDLRYSNCLETKQNCNLELKFMMYSQCNDPEDTSISKATCKTVADEMYELVRDYGSDAYADSRAACS
jgi:hypothetical protein